MPVRGAPAKRPLPTELGESEEGRTALTQILEHIKSSRGSWGAYHTQPRQEWFKKHNNDLFSTTIPDPLYQYKWTAF
jgi:hypothetical protein